MSSRTVVTNTPTRVRDLCGLDLRLKIKVEKREIRKESVEGQKREVVAF